jgi:hypothetical protein
MADTDLRLDGNAVAGILGEIFVQDMTTASIKCGGCGEVELLGAEHVYMRAPGTVMRCCHCEGVLLVIMERDDRFVLGFQQTMWLEIGRSG